MRSAGRSPADVEAAASAVGEWMDACATGAPRQRVAVLREAAARGFARGGVTPVEAADMDAALDTPTALGMYDVGTADALATIHAPALALFAGRDEIVSTASIDAARAVLAGRSNSFVEVFDDLPHNLQHSAAPGVAAFYPAPEVTDRVSGWLAARLRDRGVIRGAARRSD